MADVIAIPRKLERAKSLSFGDAAVLDMKKQCAIEDAANRKRNHREYLRLDMIAARRRMEASMRRLEAARQAIYAEYGDCAEADAIIVDCEMRAQL